MRWCQQRGVQRKSRDSISSVQVGVFNWVAYAFVGSACVVAIIAPRFSLLKKDIIPFKSVQENQGVYLALSSIVDVPTVACPKISITASVMSSFSSKYCTPETYMVQWHWSGLSARERLSAACYEYHTARAYCAEQAQRGCFTCLHIQYIFCSQARPVVTHVENKS